MQLDPAFIWNFKSALHLKSGLTIEDYTSLANLWKTTKAVDRITLIRRKSTTRHLEVIIRELGDEGLSNASHMAVSCRLNDVGPLGILSFKQKKRGDPWLEFDMKHIGWTVEKLSRFPSIPCLEKPSMEHFYHFRYCLTGTEPGLGLLLYYN